MENKNKNPEIGSLAKNTTPRKVEIKDVNLGGNWSQNFTSETMYIQEPGDSNAVSPMDIAQGQIGDCFFLASLGELAIKDPSYIFGLISGNPDGSETVNLYQDANGGPSHYDSTKQFALASFNVTNDFSPDAVNNYNTNDVVNGIKELWPQVIEKAYAEDWGGYSQINNGGYDVDAMEALTGKKAQYQQASSVTVKELQRLSNNPASITTFDTTSSGSLPDNLIGDHAYMFNGLVHQDSQTFVSLLNPWGNHEPDLVSLSDFKNDFSGINHGKV